ncbi:hypothetical protein Dimus_010705 [Dionaea muscipula]
MVGRRGPSQRRIVEACFNSRSPGPRHPVMFRGTPSPPTTFHRRPAPSPGHRARRIRTPSLVLRSSVDPGEVSSSEMEEGDSTEMTVSSEEEEGDGLRRQQDGQLGSSCLPDLSPSSSISGSPPLSLAAAVRFCQEVIDAGGHAPVSSMLFSTLVADIPAAHGLVNCWLQELEPGVGESVVVDARPEPGVGELKVADARAGPGVGDEALMAELPCPLASLTAGSGLMTVTGGESAQEVAVVTADFGGQRSMVSGSSQLPLALVSSCLSSSVPAFGTVALGLEVDVGSLQTENYRLDSCLVGGLHKKMIMKLD